MVRLNLPSTQLSFAFTVYGQVLCHSRLWPPNLLSRGNILERALPAIFAQPILSWIWRGGKHTNDHASYSKVSCYDRKARNIPNATIKHIASRVLFCGQAVLRWGRQLRAKNAQMKLGHGCFLYTNHSVFSIYPPPPCLIFLHRYDNLYNFNIHRI